MGGPDDEPLAARPYRDGDVAGGDVGGEAARPHGRLLPPPPEHLAQPYDMADFAAPRHCTRIPFWEVNVDFVRLRIDCRVLKMKLNMRERERGLNYVGIVGYI